MYKVTGKIKNDYSTLRLLMGLARAARVVLKMVVASAISSADRPTTTNIHHEIVVRYAKSCSHRFIIHQATGDAIRMEIKIRRTKSFDSRLMISGTSAPNTFLMPISLIRC